MSLAQTRLQFTTVKAPFSGITGHFPGRLGSLVDEGDLLTTLSDNNKMWVYYNLPEAEYLACNAHAKSSDKAPQVILLMANNEVFSQTAIVSTIEAKINNETSNIAFRVTCANPDALLRNGETGNVLEQFLVSSQVNYTGAYLADHLDGLTHDNARYFLKTQRFTPRQLWQQVRSGNLPTVGWITAIPV